MELTLKILDEAIKQLPPEPTPTGLKISRWDYDRMVEALEVVAQMRYTGTFIFPDDNMKRGTYEFIW